MRESQQEAVFSCPHGFRPRDVAEEGDQHSQQAVDERLCGEEPTSKAILRSLEIVRAPASSDDFEAHRRR
jgi:hypothetical protein